MKSKNKGFTLIEMIAVISIFTILLGILEPSVSSIFSYRAKKAVNSIGAALDKTKTEAMNRLVGEMKLEKRSDGYYVSYYLDRGKTNESRVVQDQPEKIAPGSILVTVYTTRNPEGVEMQTGSSLILTYDREDGSFRPIQTGEMTQAEINACLDDYKDVSFKDELIGTSGEKNYCTQIKVKGGYSTRILNLNQGAGTYTINAG